MKRALFLIALTIFFGGLNDSIAKAQEAARQLYLGYSTSDKLAPASQNGGTVNRSKGRPGAKVVIERMRNGKLAFVSPNSRFRSGDKIRLRLQTNFDGYLAILNVGSTGAVNLLFPYSGSDPRIVPSTDFQVPKADDWIVFDRNPGTETLAVVMSKRVLNAPNQDWRQLSEAATGQTRDLFVETGDDATYVVCPEEALEKPIGFVLKLKHQK